MAPMKSLKLRSRSREQPVTAGVDEEVSRLSRDPSMEGPPTPENTRYNQEGVKYVETSSSTDLSTSTIDTDRELDRLSYMSVRDPEPCTSGVSSAVSSEQQYADDEEDTLSLDRSVSIAGSDDTTITSVGCGATRKLKKKQRSREEKLRAEILENKKIWDATDVQVLEHLLMSRGSLEAWRAVADARGLCSLSEGCRCEDCQGGYQHVDTDGDAGLGAGVPIFTASLAPNCCIQ